MSQAPGSNPAVAGEIGSKASTALIASIVGLCCCPLIQIYALITVSSAEKMIQQYNVGHEHSQKLTIAKVIAIVSLILAVLGTLVQIGLMAIGGFTQPG